MRILAELRREQSCPVVEVLRELEVFTELLLEDVAALLADDKEPAAEVGAVFVVLHRALGRIGLVAMDDYQEMFLREKQERAARRSDFAETLEHEIRGPLQAATGSADLLNRDFVADDPERRGRYVGIIEDRLGRVSQLIDDLRELAVAEEALTREERRPIREVVHSVFERSRELAEERGVRLELEEPLAEIVVDPTRVEVALMNLVANAIKYADPEESERWARVSLREVGTADAPTWELSVQDDGLGIPAELCHRVFQRRVRVHPGASAGTGLGLAIVEEVMEQRGGAVRLESEEGEGSTFVLALTPRIAEPRKTIGKEEGGGEPAPE